MLPLGERLERIVAAEFCNCVRSSLMVDRLLPFLDEDVADVVWLDEAGVDVVVVAMATKFWFCGERRRVGYDQGGIVH